MRNEERRQGKIDQGVGDKPGEYGVLKGKFGKFFWEEGAINYVKFC